MTKTTPPNSHEEWARILALIKSVEGELMHIEANEKPRWYQFRWKLSNLIMRIARKIYPDNPEVKAFYLQCIYDQMIFGKSIVRINPLDLGDEE